MLPGLSKYNRVAQYSTRALDIGTRKFITLPIATLTIPELLRWLSLQSWAGCSLPSLRIHSNNEPGGSRQFQPDILHGLGWGILEFGWKPGIFDDELVGL